MDFKPGDTVRLKSGSLPMSVEQVGQKMGGGDAVWCVWSEVAGGKQKIQRDTFPPIVLEKDE